MKHLAILLLLASVAFGQQRVRPIDLTPETLTLIADSAKAIVSDSLATATNYDSVRAITNDSLTVHDATLRSVVAESLHTTFVHDTIRQSKNKTIVLVGLGDSNTAHYNADVGDGTRDIAFTGLVGRELNRHAETVDATAINEGLSGQESSWGVTNFSTLVVEQDANFVTVMFGLNDIKNGRTLSAYLNNIKSMIYSALDNNIIPIVINIPLRKSYRTTIETWNASLDSLCKIHDIDMIDVYTMFNNPADSSTYYSESGVGLGGEKRHLSREAHRILAQRIYDIIIIKTLPAKYSETEALHDKLLSYNEKNSVYFDGTGYAQILHHTEMEIDTCDFSAIVVAKPWIIAVNESETQNGLIGSWGNKPRWRFSVSPLQQNFTFLAADAQAVSATATISTDDSIWTEKQSAFAFSWDRGNSIQLFYDGAPVAYTDVDGIRADSSMTAAANNMAIGAIYPAISEFYGEIYRVLLFNRKLDHTNDYDRHLISGYGQINYSDAGADMNVVVGDDVTTMAAARRYKVIAGTYTQGAVTYNPGEEYIAWGDSVVSTGLSIQRVGCIASYDPGDIYGEYWVDGQNNNTATLVNAEAAFGEKDEFQSGKINIVFDPDTLSDGSLVSKIVERNKANNNYYLEGLISDLSLSVGWNEIDIDTWTQVFTANRTSWLITGDMTGYTTGNANYAGSFFSNAKINSYVYTTQGMDSIIYQSATYLDSVQLSTKDSGGAPDNVNMVLRIKSNYAFDGYFIRFKLIGVCEP